MIILDLIHNIALLVALVVACQVIEARWRMRRLTSQFLYGLLFGAVGVVGMMTPVRFLPGIIFDGRSIILSVGGFWGGSVVALISALLCGAYRLWVGGAGATVGVGVIMESATLGAAFYYWRRRAARPLGPRELWGFGLLVHGVMFGLMLLLPGGTRQAAWHQLGLAILGIYPVATMLTCRLFLDYEKQRHDRTALAESEARHRVTLMSVGDAVISTDVQGRVELINPVAQTLTGWRPEEARGKRLDEVFRIINEDTRQAVESPVEHVLGRGLVVGLANHTVLVAKDGTERPIADAGAPIRDEEDKIIGVALVFRDQTQERAAAKELRDSEQRFRRICEESPVAHQSRDAEGRILDVNPAWLALLGWSRAEVIGRRLNEFIPPGGQAALDEAFARFVESGVTHGREFEMRCKDGRLLTLALDGVLVRDAQGRPSYTHCVLHNITDQRRAIEALQQGEQGFRAVADYTCALECWVGMDGRLIWLNPAVEPLTGYAVEECLAMPDFPAPFLYEEDKARMVDLYRQAAAGSSGKDVEYRIRHKNGAVIWLSVSWQPIYAGDGTCLGYRSSHRDITERKRAEDKVRDSEERYRLLVEHSPDAICIQCEGKITFANSAALRLWGASRSDQILGRAVLDFVHPEYREIVAERMATIRERRVAVQRREMRHVRLDGSPVDVEASAVPITIEGKPAAQFILHDITERKQAEEALRKNEAKLRAILNATPFPIALVDVEDNQIDFWSRSALALFGHTAPTAPEWYQIAYPDPEYRSTVLGQWKPGLEKARRSAHAVNTGEYRVTCRDGSVRICELYAAFLADRLMVTFSDITERKRVEEALRERNRYIETVLENAPIGFAVNTIRDGQYVFVAGKFEEIYGVPRGSLHSADEYYEKAYLDPTFREQIRARIMADMATGDVSRMRWEDIPITTAAGEKKFVTATNIPLLDQNLMVSTVQDVTARHRAEAALRESEEKFRGVFNNALVGMFRTRLDGSEMLDMNEKFLEIFGRTREEILGLPSAIHWADPQERQEMVRRLEANGRVTDFECRMLNRQGEIRTCLTSLRSYRVEGILEGSIIDITELRRMEREVKERRTELLHVSRLNMLGEMAAGIAHELNQPLAAIVGYGDWCLHLLESSALDVPTIRKNVEEIAAQAMRASEIIRRMKALARRRAPCLTSVDVNQAVRDVIPLIRSDMVDQAVRWELDLQEPLPLVCADKIQIEQVLLNLMRNAVEAMESAQDRPCLLTVRTRVGAGDVLQVEVRDTGVGLSANEIERVFEPFFTTKREGLGMGLAICRSIIQMYKGRIWAAPGPGRGCTFGFTGSRTAADAERNGRRNSLTAAATLGKMGSSVSGLLERSVRDVEGWVYSIYR